MSDDYGRCFFDGPESVWTFGPIEVEYHRYGGPMFVLFGRDCIPGQWLGRFSPWWLLWAVLEKRMRRDA